MLSLQELFTGFSPRPANYILPILAGKYYGKPVFIWSQGLGPLHSEEGKHFATLFLSLADSGTFRDQESYLLADSLLGKEHNFHIDADPATAININTLFKSMNIDYRINSKGNERFSGKQLKIGINIRPFMDREYNAINLANQIIKELFQRYQNISDLVLVPIPFDIKEDIDALKLFMNQCDFSDIFIDSKPLENPSFTNSITNMLECDLFIGMRLHSVLMAWKLNIPTFGLSYDPKVLNFCRRYNIPVIDLANKEPFHPNILEDFITEQHFQAVPVHNEYLTPKLFKEFLDKSEKQGRLSLSELIITAKKTTTIMDYFNNIINSKGYRLVAQYYRIINWLRRFVS